MMVTCPRCKFTQPKDRYCANCGVDMDHFTPKKVPLWNRLWNNPWTQVGIMVVLLTVTINYLLLKNKLPEIPVLNEPEISEQEESLAEVAPAPEVENPIERPKLKTTAVLEQFKKQTQIQEKELPKPPKTILIRFIEIPSEIISELQSITLSSQGSALIFNTNTQEISDSLTNNLKSSNALSSTSASFSTSTPAFYTNSILVNEEEHGLVTEIAPLEFNADTSNIRFTVNFRASLPANEVQGVTGFQANYDEELSINKGQTVIVTDLLSSGRGLTEEEQGLVNSTPLSVLGSQEFQNGETVFAIVIQMN